MIRTFYWEFIIMLKKIVIIFIKVFLATNGRIVQALVSLLFLFISLIATMTIRPY